MSTGKSAFYADLGTSSAGNSGLGYTTLTGTSALQVVKLTERIDQVTYPNLWSGFATTFAQNNATTPVSLNAGSFNNVLVKIVNRTI